MIEILAPAGDEKSFFSAINAGANAIYLGLSDFSARKNAANFNLDNLKYYIDYAHFFGVRIYVAMNTLVKDGELCSFIKTLVSAHNLGADAIIMQDIFLGKIIKEKYPEITLHLSTQAGVCNVYGARLAKRYGFSRVILARETPIESIREITKIIETESFVQGALCTCFSGQCYMSSFVGGNSGNRGYCKQPCRKRYKVNRRGFEDYSYAVSLSDLSVGADIVKLVGAGVVSFKIEGRMRSPEYVYSAVNYYREILNGKTDLKTELSALKRTYNRGNYTKGYLFGQDKNLFSRDVQGHLGELIGRVKKVGKFAYIESNYNVKKGDGFKIIRNGKKEVGGFVYTEVKPRDKCGFYILNTAQLKVDDGVYITTDNSLATALLGKSRKRKITVSLLIKEGEKIKASAFGDFSAFTVQSDFCAEIANNKGVSVCDMEACFLKTDLYPFEVAFENNFVEENVFIARSQLNAFRREFYKKLFEHLSFKEVKVYDYTPIEFKQREDKKSQKLVVIDSLLDKNLYGDIKLDYFVFKPKNYQDITSIRRFCLDSEYYVTHKLLYISAFSLEQDIKNIKNIAEYFYGIYCDGVFGIELANELNLPLVLGTGANIFNSVDVKVAQDEGAELVVLSKELSLAEAENISSGNTIIQAGGSIKMMDLGHCLFSKTCKNCDKQNCYFLTDDSGREFPLVRYKNSGCKFELYNCVPLVMKENSRCGLYDFTALSNEQKTIFVKGICSNTDLKVLLKSYTLGHYKKGIK